MVTALIPPLSSVDTTVQSKVSLAIAAFVNDAETRNSVSYIKIHYEGYAIINLKCRNTYVTHTCCCQSSYASDVLVKKRIMKVRETLIKTFSFMFDSLFGGFKYRATNAYDTCICC